MTKFQAIQYHRFLATGYDPEDAHAMIERGVWLSGVVMTAEEIADVRRYRSERDGEPHAEAVPEA